MRVEFYGDRCVWCRSCELVCSLYREGVCSPMLSRIRIRLNIFDAEVSAFVCRQCDGALCAKACPAKAIHFDKRVGAYVVDEGRCRGCGLCAKACPYNKEGKIIFFNGVRGIFVKCDLCHGEPQCVEVCPSGALRVIG